jgi:putative flippase GtrA
MPSLRRLATFATIGAAATIGYAVIAESLTYLGCRPVLASLIAYAICACGSYLGHKRFTFGSAGRHSVEAPRFFVATLVGLLVALAMPLLFARFFGPSPYFAILATCILVPILSFIASARFVFRHPSTVIASGARTNALHSPREPTQAP